MRREPVPDEHHALAGGEAGQLLQHLDAAIGVVAGLLEMEAQPGRGAVGQVAEAAAMEAFFQPKRWRSTGR